jgi:hypothetical protein
MKGSFYAEALDPLDVLLAAQTIRKPALVHISGSFRFSTMTMADAVGVTQLVHVCAQAVRSSPVVRARE